MPTLENEEIVYAAAFGLYEKGDYARASDLFTHLVLRSPFDAKFWLGLASARQMDKKYQESLHAWAIVAFLKMEDPMPHFHAAECLLSLQQNEEALKALRCAENNLTANDASGLKEKITLLREQYG